MGNIFCLDKSTVLIINTTSNKPIKNLHPRIKKIKFHPNSKCYPKLLLDDNLTIETIDLSKIFYYTEELENLPPRLENLYLSDVKNKLIKNFPQNLRILECGDEFYFINQTKIPNTIKKLKLTQSGISSDIIIEYSILPTFLPENLEELYFEYEDGYTPEQEYLEFLIKLFDNLPDNLRILKIPNFWNYPLSNLPLTLEKIYLGIEFNQELNSLPESIVFMEFVEQYKFNKSLNDLPSQLEYLNLGFQNKYHHSISNLPNSIKYLELGEYKLCIEKLPTQLVELHIASPVIFIPIVDEKINIIEASNKLEKQDKKIQYYQLEEIGEYNIKNNIFIKIPENLSKIVYWDGDSSVYEFNKSSDNNLWYEKK